MRLRRQPLALDDEHDVVHVGRLAGQGPLDERHEVAARLCPDVQKRPAEGVAVLRTENSAVGIIVEKRQALAPDGEHRLLGGEHDANQRLQRRRPCLDRAQRRPGPIDGAHPAAQVAAAVEDGVLGLVQDISSYLRSDRRDTRRLATSLDLDDATGDDRLSG